MSKAEEIIRKEWDLIKKNPILSEIGCSAGPKKKTNMFEWNAIIRGPKNSPYDGYLFKFTISFKNDYPNSAPTVKCESPVKHMNISSNGNVCVDSITKLNRWNEIKDVSSLLLSIFVIFKKPNPESPYNKELAKLYKNDKKKYEEEIRAFCENNKAIKIVDG